jgi:hypothetical protein
MKDTLKLERGYVQAIMLKPQGGAIFNRPRIEKKDGDFKSPLLEAHTIFNLK